MVFADRRPYRGHMSNGSEDRSSPSQTPGSGSGFSAPSPGSTPLQQVPGPDPYSADHASRGPAGNPPSGTVAWAMGFLAYIPIPFVGSVVTGFVMMLVGNAQRAKGETARLNGRNAANWGFTYLVATVVLIGAAVLVLSTSVDADGRVTGAPSAIALTLIAVWGFPLQILHLVLTIMGTVKASRGTVFANRFAIPLLR